jgi:two-component system, chemotaxis family, response regulator Rcp1
MFPVHHILLVEDNPGDVRLAREAMAGWATAAISLHVVTNGEDALQFVWQTNRYTDAPRPDLIVLDLNLQRLSGLEVLKRLKDIPGLWQIPTIMLSSVEAEEHVQSTYKPDANAYLVEAHGLVEVMKHFGNIETRLTCA